MGADDVGTSLNPYISRKSERGTRRLRPGLESRQSASSCRKSVGSRIQLAFVPAESTKAGLISVQPLSLEFHIGL